jgi:glycerophosphoryl diester phosphodiesterase
MCEAQEEMLVIGHRGAKGLAPENTLSAFAEALKYHVDAVELDVFICKSGELVVIHDNDVRITTNGEGFAVDKTLSELKELEIIKNQKISTLEEVLDLIDKKVVVNIEIKGENVADQLGELITRYVIQKGWSYDHFLVSSFDHPQLEKFRTLYPSIPLGLLYVGTPLGYAADAEYLKAQYVILSEGILRQKFIHDAHQRGIKVLVFTVNDKKRAQRLQAQGVDGIITDFPNLFLK